MRKLVWLQQKAARFTGASYGLYIDGTPVGDTDVTKKGVQRFQFMEVLPVEYGRYLRIDPGVLESLQPAYGPPLCAVLPPERIMSALHSIQTDRHGAQSCLFEPPGGGVIDQSGVRRHAPIKAH